MIINGSPPKPVNFIPIPFNKQMDKKSHMSSDGKSCHYRRASLSDSEMMTIIIEFQYGLFNFKR